MVILLFILVLVVYVDCVDKYFVYCIKIVCVLYIIVGWLSMMYSFCIYSTIKDHDIRETQIYFRKTFTYSLVKRWPLLDSWNGNSIIQTL